MKQLILKLAIIINLVAATAFADIEWGGGNVMFHAEDQTLLTSYNGLATLVAVRQGKLIRMDQESLEESDIWVTPGSIISDGKNVNIILAVSWAFDNGLLWMSGSPNVSSQTMASYGVLSGDRLYLIIWDRNSFQWNHPVKGSNYTALPLFVDGDITIPATAYGDADFGDAIRPDNNIDHTAICNNYLSKPKGDINNDSQADLKDVILILQIFSNIDVSISNHIKYIDINGNMRVDFEELIYVLQVIVEEG